jgi:hypothetical protein
VNYSALPTGNAHTQAVVVAVPPGVAAPDVDGTNPGRYGGPATASSGPMLALFVAQWSVMQYGAEGTATELRCALPAPQSSMCAASVQLMLENSGITAKAPARDALQQFLAAHS